MLLTQVGAQPDPAQPDPGSAQPDPAQSDPGPAQPDLTQPDPAQPDPGFERELALQHTPAPPTHPSLLRPHNPAPPTHPCSTQHTPAPPTYAYSHLLLPLRPGRVLQRVALRALGLGPLLSRPTMLLPRSVSARVLPPADGAAATPPSTHPNAASMRANESKAHVPSLTPVVLGAFSSNSTHPDPTARSGNKSGGCVLAAIDAVSGSVLWRWPGGCPAGQLAFVRGALVFGRHISDGGGVVALGWGV